MRKAFIIGTLVTVFWQLGDILALRFTSIGNFYINVKWIENLTWPSAIFWEYISLKEFYGHDIDYKLATIWSLPFAALNGACYVVAYRIFKLIEKML